MACAEVTNLAGHEKASKDQLLIPHVPTSPLLGSICCPLQTLAVSCEVTVSHPSGGFLNFGTTDLLVCIILCWGAGLFCAL